MKSAISIQTAKRQGSCPYQHDRMSVLQLPHKKLISAVVLDGMGSSDCAELTADIALVSVQHSIVAQSMCTYTPPLERIAQHAIRDAVRIVNGLHESYSTPGSTALVAIIDESGHVGVSWLGDSMAIVARDQTYLITPMHNAGSDKMYQALFPDASGPDLTRYLGEIQFSFDPDCRELKLEYGETLYLISDGAQQLFRGGARPTVEQLRAVPDEDLPDNATMISITRESPCNMDDTRQLRK